eukprot:6992295-Ditylum_brightwellii.AAC.1
MAICISALKYLELVKYQAYKSLPSIGLHPMPKMLFQCFNDSALYSSGISELNVLYATSTNGAHSKDDRPYTQGLGPSTTAPSS